jgi:hypothetical protein
MAPGSHARIHGCTTSLCAAHLIIAEDHHVEHTSNASHADKEGEEEEEESVSGRGGEERCYSFADVRVLTTAYRLMLGSHRRDAHLAFARYLEAQLDARSALNGSGSGGAHEEDWDWHDVAEVAAHYSRTLDLSKRVSFLERTTAAATADGSPEALGTASIALEDLIVLATGGNSGALGSFCTNTGAHELPVASRRPSYSQPSGLRGLLETSAGRRASTDRRKSSTSSLGGGVPGRRKSSLQTSGVPRRQSGAGAAAASASAFHNTDNVSGTLHIPWIQQSQLQRRAELSRDMLPLWEAQTAALAGTRHGGDCHATTSRAVAGSAARALTASLAHWLAQVGHCDTHTPPPTHMLI